MELEKYSARRNRRKNKETKKKQIVVGKRFTQNRNKVIRYEYQEVQSQNELCQHECLYHLHSINLPAHQD